MLEPQSTALFILLMVVFCALVCWMALARQMVFRVFAACLAFIPAMLFGVAAVNKYYDYYQTWGAVAADLGGQGVSQVTSATSVNDASARQVGAILGSHVNGRAAAAHGQTIRLIVPGQASHLRRTAFVYLPPQYFRASFSGYRFPVIELLPGFPGSPADWINVVGITQAYSTLLADGAPVKPAVLVMPDANGGRHLAAVPERAPWAPGRHLPGPGRAGVPDAHPAGAAARTGLGNRRLLRGRLLRRQPGPGVPAAVRRGRRDERLLHPER